MEDKKPKEELQSIKQTLTGVVIGLVFISDDDSLDGELILQ